MKIGCDCLSRWRDSEPIVGGASCILNSNWASADNFCRYFGTPCCDLHTVVLVRFPWYFVIVVNLLSGVQCTITEVRAVLLSNFDGIFRKVLMQEFGAFNEGPVGLCECV